MKRNPLLFTENVDGDRVVEAPTRVPTAIAVIAGAYVCIFVCAVIVLRHQTEKGILSLSHESGICGKLV